MEIFIAVLCAIIVLLCVAILVKLNGSAKGTDAADSADESEQLLRRLDTLNREMLDAQSRLRLEVGESVTNSVARLGDSLRDEQRNQQKMLEQRLAKMETELGKIRSDTLIMLEKMRTDNNSAIDRLRTENRESLDKINGTVNEKLQKTLDDKITRSFEAVNKRLAEVYEGLGEMKNVASGVSDLKNVLSNVKTRGIMGEIQLGAILGEILAPEQYGEQIPVTPNGRERVDFAVKLPGAEDGGSVYLPIDSKFPGDSYANLLEAYDSGDTALIKSRRATLDAEIKSCAKSIHDKYIEPPYTTDFAIMFLPFEGLYAEVVNMGLVEQLQSKYKVNIAGPSTMAAMLNSLQMGFRTLAIQQKSGEVWKILEAAKKEFAAFEDVLSRTRNRLRQADEELEKLVGTRTRAINRRLRDVQMLESDESAERLIDET
jgi:DNA recombination protein RmuC